MGAKAIGLALGAFPEGADRGLTMPEMVRALGVDPDAVEAWSGTIADEAFMTLPGLPADEPARGALEGLPVDWVEPVRDQLGSTFALALAAGVAVGRAIERDIADE